MKAVEVRRHSLRTPPEEHLSPAGVALAAQVGLDLGRFDRVISSPSTRAVETSIGLGHPPDGIEPRWAELGEAVARELPWPFGFDEARHRVEVVGSAARATSGELWSSLRNHLRAVPEGGGLLVVTHGGFCELLLAGSGLSPAPLEALGPVRCLEGVRFELQAKVPCSAELLRLPDGATRV